MSREGDNSLRILTSFRDFKLRFVKENEAAVWFSDILALSGSKVLEHTDLLKQKQIKKQSNAGLSESMKQYKALDLELD